MFHLSSSSLLASAATLVLAGASVAFVAYRIAGVITKDDRLLKAVLVAFIAVLQMVGVPLALGIVDLLARTPVLLVHVVLAVAVYVLVPSRPKSERARAWTPLGLGALGAGVAVAFAAAAPTIRGVPTQATDTIAYHVVNLATWMQHHNIWSLPFQNPGYYTATHPGNGEMLGLWLTLPSHSDLLTYLGVIAFGVLTVLAVALLTRDLGGDERIGALAGIAIVAAPISFTTQAHSLSTNLASTSGLVVATALLLRARNAEAARDRIILAALAGAGVGLGLGSKYTALIPAGLLVVWVLATMRPWRAIVAFLPGLILFAAPWFIRNAIRTGNPLFPQDVQLAGAHILAGGTTPLDAIKTSLMQHLRAGHWAVIKRWGHLAVHFFGYAGLLGIGGIAAVRRSPQRTARVVVALLAVAALIGYAMTPYTGGGPNGSIASLLGSNMRYALTGVVLAVAVGAGALPRFLTAVLLAASFLYDGYQIAHGAGFRSDINITASSGALIVLVTVAVVLSAAYGRTLREAFAERIPDLSPAAARAIASVAILALFLVVSYAMVTHIDHARPIDQIEAAVDRADGLGGPIVVLGIQDVRATLGPDLANSIESLVDGTRGRSNPIGSAAALDQALARSDARVLVVPARSGGLGVPKGWSPPSGWTVAGKTSTTTVYVKPGPAANAAPAPAPSPTPTVAK